MTNQKSRVDKPKESPQVVEMEKYVLGAMMLKGGAVVPEVIAKITANDFFDEEHKTIFRSIIEVATSGVAPSILTVADNLRQKKMLDKIGLDYVLSLPENVNSLVYVGSYIDIIKEKATLRNLIKIGEEISQAGYTANKPVVEVLNDVVSVLTDFQKVSSGFKVSSVGDIMKNSFRQYTKSRQKYANRKTDFFNIDEKQIFEPGLYIIGATPSAGKTTFCWQLLDQLANQGEPCFYFTFEMSKEALVAKSYSRILYQANFVNTFSGGQIHNGWWSDELDKITEAYSERSQDNMDVKIIEVDSYITIDTFLSQLQPLVYNCDKSPVICIDYLQYIKPTSDNAKMSIDEVLRQLKDFQRKTDTTFIVISSLNRMNYYQQIGLESFKESGNIEYAADVIWGMQLNIINTFKNAMSDSDKRLKYMEAMKSPERQVELKCLKYRTGMLYDCYFNYHPAHDYFEAIDNPNPIISENERKVKNEKKCSLG